MKIKVKVTDNISGKVKTGEVTVRQRDHLEAQIKYPHRVQRDRTKYTRKTKHKNKGEY